MNSIELLTTKVSTLESLLDGLISRHGEEFAASASIFSKALKQGNTIFWCGNGGSASESSHLAVELIGRFKNNRRPLPSISLNSDTSAITCIANDFGYDQIFVRQLRVLARRGDVLVAISASGNSQNLLTAVEFAKQNGIQTTGLTAFDGGKLRKMVDQCVHVPTGLKEYGPAEDAHMVLDHLVGAYLMRLVNSE